MHMIYGIWVWVNTHPKIGRTVCWNLPTWNRGFWNGSSITTVVWKSESHQPGSSLSIPGFQVRFSHRMVPSTCVCWFVNPIKYSYMYLINHRNQPLTVYLNWTLRGAPSIQKLHFCGFSLGPSASNRPGVAGAHRLAFAHRGRCEKSHGESPLRWSTNDGVFHSWSSC
jgi:hypothetical protein